LIPVLIRVAIFAKAYEKDNTLHFIEYVEKELTSRPEFGHFLRNSIEHKECLIILDGLDEVADRSLRIQITDLIQKMVAEYNGNYFLVTSRIIGYDVSPLTQEFQHATLKALTSKEQELFVNLWYDAISTEITIEEIGAGAEDLIKALRDKPQIARMAANPLLLTIIVLMHWRGVKLPSRRVQVYENATDTLVEYWTAQRGATDLDAIEVKGILAPIAHYILSSNVGGVISHQDLLPRFYRGIVAQRGCNEKEAKRIGRKMLQDINEQSGVFLERGIDEYDRPVYGFLHQTFGEYLAALHMVDEIQSGDFEINNYIHRSIWHEPLLLMVGHLSIQNRHQANQLIRTILDFPAPFEETLQRNVLLVVDCLADDIQIEPSLRDEILTKLAGLLSHEVPQVQQAAIQRYQRLDVTRHRDAAIRAVLKQYPCDDKDNFRKQSNTIQKNIAKALVYLGETDRSQTMVWDLEKLDRYDQDISRLRFLGWPDQAMDYLIECHANSNYYFDISIGADLSECTLGFANASSIIEGLGMRAFQILVQKLIQNEKDPVQRGYLKWISFIATEQQEISKLKEFMKHPFPISVRMLSATKMVDGLEKDVAIAYLLEIAQTSTEHAPAAAKTLAMVGEIDAINLQLLRETALLPFDREAPESITSLFELGDRLFALCAAIQLIARYPRSVAVWQTLQMLMSHDEREIGLATARYLSMRPDFKYRFEACKVFIDLGQTGQIIPSLEILVFESFSDSGQLAGRELLLLRETENILPVLAYKTRYGSPSQKYQASLALALAGQAEMAESYEGAKVSQKLPYNRKKLFQKYRQGFAKSCYQFLSNLETEDSNLQTAKNLALIALHQNFGERLSTNDILDMLKGSGPLARTHASWFRLRSKNQRNNLEKVYADLDLTISLVSAPVRRQNITEVSKIAHPISTDNIKNALGDEDESVRSSAADALGELGDLRAVEPLLTALEDEDESVRSSAADALGNLGDPKAVEPLLTALGDEAYIVRYFAGYALRNLGDPRAVEPLLTALEDENERVRSSAAHALGNLGDPRAAPLLAVKCSTYQHGFALLKLDLQIALDTLKKHTQWFPLKDWIFRLYGQALWMDGDSGGAKKQFRLGVQKHPTSENYLALAHYYIENGEISAAQEQVKYAVEKAKRLNRSQDLMLAQDVVDWLSGEKDLRFKVLKEKRGIHPNETEMKQLQEIHFWREKALAALQEIIDAVAQT
jgi:hypothetical protein